jgi:hypothetical protein
MVLAASTLVARAQAVSKFPDLSGQWNRVPDGDVPRYDPTKPIRKQQVPLRPECRVLRGCAMRVPAEAAAR